MSSPANGPYNSRLFNFLNRQSYRLKEQYKQAVRHTTVAVVWGVQVALYPVYVLMQAVRLAGHKLQQATQQKRVSLQDKKPSSPDTPPPADMPIQRVLNVVVEKALLGETARGGAGLRVRSTEGMKTNSPFPIPRSQFPLPYSQLATKSPSQLAEAEEKLSSARLMISGVACLIQTRRLVLVTVDNEILDILTVEQRQKLHQRIICEIAYYWRQWRSTQASRRQFRGCVQMLPQEQSRLLPPVRFFWQVMAWVQTSPVATKVNLFGESTIVKTQPPRKKSRVRRKKSTVKRQTLTLPFAGSLTVIDRKVASIEAQARQPVSQLTSSISDRTQGMLQRLQEKISETLTRATSSESQVTGDSESNNWLRINSLIQAAIDYFFGFGGGHRNPVSPRNRVSKGQLPPDMENHHQLAAGEEENPWLIWKDLFDDLAAPIRGKKQETRDNRDSISNGDTLGEQAPAQLPGKTRVKRSLPAGREVVLNDRSMSSGLKRNLTLRQTDLARRTAADTSKLAETQQNGKAVAQSQIVSAPNANLPVSTTQGKIEQVAQDSAKPVAISSQDEVLPDHKPEWIETEATSTGYVKQPLERLLELLDRGMLWLEGLFAKIWRWVKGG